MSPARALVRRSAVALALVGALVGADIGAATAEVSDASDATRLGAHVHVLWPDHDAATRTAILDRLADAGIRSVRVDVRWASEEERCRGCIETWVHDRLDAFVADAETRGIDVLLVLHATPKWANGGRSSRVPPDEPADFGAFAGRLADRLRGRTAGFEVWNEPNIDDFYMGTPEQYVDLLAAAHAAIRRADPSARVVLGGTSHNDTVWLGHLYELGAAPFFDVLATHPYTGPSDLPPDDPRADEIWHFRHVAAVRDLMVRHGDVEKEIWFTEFGWSAHPTAEDAPNWKRGVSSGQQADYAVRALELIAAEFPYVTRAYWYNAWEKASGDPHEDGFGLLARDLEPKPVYEALRAWLDDPSSPADPIVCEDGTAVTVRFRDVASGSVHQVNIECLAASGIVRGLSASTYGPELPVTRAQFASLLARLLEARGIALPSGDDAFDDDNGSPHEPSIDALASAGIIGGVGPRSFAPDAPIVRAQLATLLVNVARTAGVEVTGQASDRFDDDDGSVHEDNINAAAADGLVRGVTADRYEPLRVVTRAQAASFTANLDRSLAAG